MKPAEAVSSSGLGTIRPDRQILNQPHQFCNYRKKKNNSAALYSQQLAIHTDTMLRRRLGNSFGSGSDVCTDSFGSGSDVCTATRR